MTELLVRAQAIESTVNEIRSIVTAYCFSNKKPRNARKNAPGIQDNAPPWADMIISMLAQILADVQDVKRVIQSSPFDSGHGQNAPAREPSQTVDGPGLLSQPAGEEPATAQNTRDSSSNDTSRTHRPSTPESRSSDQHEPASTVVANTDFQLNRCATRKDCS
jgi:hypothetical protein